MMSMMMSVVRSFTTRQISSRRHSPRCPRPPPHPHMKTTRTFHRYTALSSSSSLNERERERAEVRTSRTPQQTPLLEALISMKSMTPSPSPSARAAAITANEVSDCFLSGEMLELERPAILDQSWIFTSFVQEDFSHIGDHCIVPTCTHANLIISRPTSDTFCAMQNSCTHLKAPLLGEKPLPNETNETCSSPPTTPTRALVAIQNAQKLVCPFHHWTFDMSGNLLRPITALTMDPEQRVHFALGRAPLYSLSNFLFVKPVIIRESSRRAEIEKEFSDEWRIGATSFIHLTRFEHDVAFFKEASCNWKVFQTALALSPLPHAQAQTTLSSTLTMIRAYNQVAMLQCDAVNALRTRVFVAVFKEAGSGAKSEFAADIVQLIDDVIAIGERETAQIALSGHCTLQISRTYCLDVLSHLQWKEQEHARRKAEYQNRLKRIEQATAERKATLIHEKEPMSPTPLKSGSGS